MTTDSNNCRVEIRLAQPIDEPFIEKSFNEHFLEYETLNVYLKDYRPREGIYQCVPNNGLTLIAEVILPSGERNYAGFLLNAIHKLGESHERENYLLRTDNPVGYEIYRMQMELYRKYDVFERYQVDEYFELAMLGLDPKYRGKSIGYLLLEAGLNLAVSRGYRVVSADCSGHYSAKIAKKLKMDAIGSVSYDEHRSESGEKMFTPQPPHSHFIRFVKIMKVKSTL